MILLMDELPVGVHISVVLAVVAVHVDGNVGAAHLGQSTVTAADSIDALKALDSNPSSSYRLNGEMAFDRKEGSNTITMLGGTDSNVTVKQFNAKGQEIASSKFSTPYATVQLLPDTKRVSIDGTATIYEAIQK